MRARLQACEPIAGEWRRAFLGGLAEALADATAHPKLPPEERRECVRRIRKATKALRAMLPLLAGVASADARAGAERCLADAAGVLSPLRDRDAMLSIIDRLLAGRDDARATLLRAELAAALVPGIGAGEEGRLDVLLVARAAVELRRVRAAAEGWAFDGFDARGAASSLVDAYREARRLARSPWQRQPIAASHAVRKACSRLHLQLQLLDARNRKLRPPRRGLKSICDLLGEEHDLAMLSERVALESRRFSREGLPAAVGRSCAAARGRLRGAARETIGEVFSMRPERLARRATKALS